MPRPPSRRAFLRATTGVVVSVAGCLDIADVPDLQLFNNADRDATVTTTIERVDSGVTVFSDTTTIGGDGTHRYRNPIREARRFEFASPSRTGRGSPPSGTRPRPSRTGLTVHLSADGVKLGKIVS